MQCARRNKDPATNDSLVVRVRYRSVPLNRQGKERELTEDSTYECTGIYTTRPPEPFTTGAVTPVSLYVYLRPLC